MSADWVARHSINDTQYSIRSISVKLDALLSVLTEEQQEKVIQIYNAKMKEIESFDDSDSD